MALSLYIFMDDWRTSHIVLGHPIASLLRRNALQAHAGRTCSPSAMMLMALLLHAVVANQV